MLMPQSMLIMSLFLTGIGFFSITRWASTGNHSRMLERPERKDLISSNLRTERATNGSLLALCWRAPRKARLEITREIDCWLLASGRLMRRTDGHRSPKMKVKMIERDTP